MASRRADAVAVIARAAVAAALHGTGSARLGGRWAYHRNGAGLAAPSPRPRRRHAPRGVACARAAITWHSYPDADTGALLGRFGIAAAL